MYIISARILVNWWENILCTAFTGYPLICCDKTETYFWTCDLTSCNGPSCVGAPHLNIPSAFLDFGQEYCFIFRRLCMVPQLCLCLLTAPFLGRSKEQVYWDALVPWHKYTTNILMIGLFPSRTCFQFRWRALIFCIPFFFVPLGE
jgi:hypothetical protein